MQLAGDGSRASDPSKRGFLSPGKAFALLFGVIVLIGAAVFLLRPDDLPRGSFTYPAGEAPTFELTDAEAIARFEVLDQYLKNVYAERDASLISLALTSDSPLVEIGVIEVQRLKRDNVLDKSIRKTRHLEIISNTSEEIVVRQILFEHTRFFSESGKKVGGGDQPFIQTIDWVLHFENGQWKVFDTDVVDTKPAR